MLCTDYRVCSRWFDWHYSIIRKSGTEFKLYRQYMMLTHIEHDTQQHTHTRQSANCHAIQKRRCCNAIRPNKVTYRMATEAATLYKFMWHTITKILNLKEMFFFVLDFTEHWEPGRWREQSSRENCCYYGTKTQTNTIIILIRIMITPQQQATHDNKRI